MTHFLDDLAAAALRHPTDEGDDPGRCERGDGGDVYVCTACPWRDRGGMLAFAHHQATGHPVRGRDWPADWPNAIFSGGR